MSKIDITEAIKRLPAEFITPEMVMAAAGEHDPKLINILPAGMLTAEVVEMIFSGYIQYGSFDLSKIPVECRSQLVCDEAVDRDSKNLFHVPDAMKTPELISKVLRSDRDLHLWAMVPQQVWSRQMLYAILKPLKSRSAQADRDKTKMLRELQVMLSYVPSGMKNRRFYFGLLDQDVLPIEVIVAITPSKHKTLDFYKLIAGRDFRHVPKEKRCYELYLAAFAPDSKTSTFRLLTDDDGTLAGVMDDALADLIIENRFSAFDDLPAKFQTEERLLFAISVYNREGNKRSLESLTRVREELLTRRVCEELIKANDHYVPKIPEAYWDADMVAFCLKHTTHYHWFDQMPRKFQTRQMVVDAINDWQSNMEYARKEFIGRPLAEKLYRDMKRDNYHYREKYLPQKYFKEFTQKTGLPVEFFGGEVSLPDLKANHGNFTWCRIGDMHVGVYNSDRYWRSQADRIIITKVTDGKVETIRDTDLGTLHKTWLEKIVAENDPSFVKPVVDKSLKDVQGAYYYGVEHIRTEDGTELYRNTFYGLTACYCARRDGITYHSDSEAGALGGLNDKIRKSAGEESDWREGDDKVLTANELHLQFGFCYLGMGVFTEEYGLDIKGSYTVGELRQIIKEKGRKSSLNRFERELRRIHVI